MVGAVGACGAAAPVAGQAQLQRLQHQLADNLNCASANTRQGKVTIAAIEEKISALKQQIQDPPAPTRIGSTSGALIDVYA